MEVAAQLHINSGCAVVGEISVVKPSTDAFGPAPTSGDCRPSRFQPDQPMGRQGDGVLGRLIQLGKAGQSPTAAAFAIFKKQIDVGSLGIIRCIGVVQQGVARHELCQMLLPS